MLVKIDDIKVKNRVRKDLGDLSSLMESLRVYGLLNPITLKPLKKGKYQLIAGERRLEAAKSIGWTSIHANVIESVSEIKQLEMELEENNQRKEFTEEELLEGYTKLKRLQHPNIFVRFWNLLKRFFAWIASLFSKK